MDSTNRIVTRPSFFTRERLLTMQDDQNRPAATVMKGGDDRARPDATTDATGATGVRDGAPASAMPLAPASVEERYRALVHAAGHLVWTATGDGVLTDASSWCIFTGQSPDDVARGGSLDAIHPDDRARAARIWREAVAAQRPYESEFRVRRYDGVYRAFLVRGTPIFADDGSVREWLGFGADVTDRASAERERDRAAVEADARARQLEAIFEAIADAIFIYDRNGNITQMNAAAHVMVGTNNAPGYAALPAHDRIAQTPLRDENGRPLPEDQWAVWRILRGEELTGAHTLDVTITTLDGRDVHLNVSGAPIYDDHGALSGAVAICRDVTERRRAERRIYEALRTQLSGHNATLPDEAADWEYAAQGPEAGQAAEGQGVESAVAALDEPTQSLVLLAARREATRRMEDFIAMASHELRTPLTSIIGYTQLMQRQVYLALARSDATAEQLTAALSSVDQGCRQISRQTARLKQLTTDLLEVTRLGIDRIPLDMSRHDLRAIVREAVDEQSQLDPDHPIRLKLGEAPLTVHADAGYMREVVTHYLSNALKFSSPGQVVTVYTAARRGTARVEVRDHGCGLPPDEHDRVWERFYRVEGVEHRSGSSMGLGLGLYRSRVIVERHQGRVGLRSAPGRGSTFWFTLPLAD